MNFIHLLGICFFLLHCAGNYQQTREEKEINGQIREYHTYLDGCTADDPRRPTVIYHLGNLYYKKENNAYKKSVAVFDERIEDWKTGKLKTRPKRPKPVHI